jgi:hypothetical protein
MAEIIAILDVLAAIILIVPAYYVFKLGKITGWFKAWGFVAATFIVAIALRTIVALQSVHAWDPVALNYFRAVMNVVVSIFALIGYTSLYTLFKEQKGKR